MPRGTGERALRRFLDQSAGWIARRLDEERERAARHSLGLAQPGTVWLAGERLTIRREPGRSAAVRRGGVLVVSGSDPHGAIDRWYRREARRLVEAAAAREAGRIGVECERIAVRDQRTRWGSCSTRGTLSFSWRLALAPPEVLEYVVVHELLHLREHNHSRAFWALLDEHRPGWREQVAWLRDHGEELQAYGQPRRDPSCTSRRNRVSGPSRSCARASTLWLAGGLAIVFALGVAFRVYAERDSVLGIPNSDEAVLGLMARHLLHGHLTTFIWGEAYGGPQEILLAVPGFAIAGSELASRCASRRCCSSCLRSSSSGASAYACSGAGRARRPSC